MISIVSFVYLIGALQGVVLAPALFFRHSNHSANRLLALLNLIFTLTLLDAYFIRINLYLKYPHLLLLTLPLLFMIGPILYYFSLFLTHNRQHFHLGDLRHILPTVLTAIVFMPFYLKPGYEKIVDFNDFSLWITIMQIALAGQCLIYLYFSFKGLRRYRVYIAEVFSELGRINLQWLNTLLSLCSLLFVVYLMELLAEIFFKWEMSYSYYAISLTIYLIGYASMRQQPLSNLPGKSITTESPPESSQSRFEDGTTEEKLQTLLAYMDKEKPHQNPDLSLADLAQQLSLSPHNLSYLINSRLSKNFYHFINHYRVEDVKRMLADKRHRAEDLLSLAFAAGFNAKTTFNTIFKSYTQMTPSEYRKTHQLPRD